MNQSALMKYTLLLAIVLNLSGQPAVGGSLGVWTGGGGANTNWSIGANWEGSAVPVFPVGLAFAGTSGLTNHNDLGSITVNSFTFDAAAGAFVLNGNNIALGGNIGFNGNPASPVTQTVNFNMAWSLAALGVDTPGNGDLLLGGAIVSAADYSLNKTGAGTLTLAGTNSIAGMGVNGGTNIITGNTTIAGNGDGNDRLYVGDGDSLNGCNGTLIIQTGAVLTVNGSFGDTFVIGRDSGSGTVIQNGGTFTFNPANISLMLICATSGAGTTAAYDMNGGLLNMSGNALGAGYADAGAVTTGMVNQVGGVITNLNNLELGLQQSGGLGVYTLSGGSIYIGARGITTGTGNYAINLGGGTVGATASWASSLNLNLTNLNGAVTFDTAGNTITLSGALAGNGGLSKIGAGTLELSGANTYAGDTAINAGILQLDVTGSSSGAFRLASGAKLNLNFSGAYVVAACYTNGVALPDGVYTASTLSGFITGSGSLQVVGSVSTGLWTGGGVNNDWSTGGNWDQNVVPIFPIGLTFAGSARVINSNDLVGLTVNSITFDPAAGPFVLDGNGVALNGNIGFKGNPAAPITQTVNLNMAWRAGETIDTPTNGNLTFGGDITSSVDTSLIKLDAGTLILGGTNTIASWDLDGGTTIVTGNTTISGDGNSRIYVGNGDAFANCNGALIIQNGAALTINGNFADSFVIGRDSGSGTLIQNGGTFTFSPGNPEYFFIGATSEAGTWSEFDMNGGRLNLNGNNFGVALGNSGVLSTGVVNQVGGAIANAGSLQLGALTASGYGVYNLSGGSIYIGSGGITTVSGNYAINLGGGTVGATASWASSLNMNLTGANGPVTFDTAANTITLSGVLSGNGGLTKVGSGTLELSGATLFTGYTTVNAGTLQLDANSSRPGAIRLASRAKLNLNYSGAYVIARLLTNGVALPSGTYNAANLPGFITGSGALQVVGLSVNYSLDGTSLALSWPPNYLGWVLQVQTNSLMVGLSTNWVDVAGSANVSATNMSVNLSSPTIFYRLSPPPPPSGPSLIRQMVVTNNLLNLPVKNGATMRRFTITVGGKSVQDFDIELADGVPDWWAFVDLTPYQGQTATLMVNNLSPGSTGLSSVVQSNGIVGATNLYAESLRPQLHYSNRRGILNDVNGLVYYNGQYNLYYQHNPYGWSFGYNADGAQRNWGHAVSPDMVHWQEMPDAIYPHSYGDYVWSGSAVIDTANTGGFKTGTNDVIVASYYSLLRGQSIAYSNDGGLTYTDYASNPVVNVTGRDPHLLWYAPSNYWVMVVYDSNLGGVDFFSTPDFHTWTYRSGITGFYECPDMFQLPVDGNTNNMLWELNDGSSGYMLGYFNGAVFTPTTPKLPGNSGSGFYASQTFTVMPAGDARRVRMGWAQTAMPGMPFNQMLFFPTVLTLQTLPAGVRLCSSPIAEITNAVENVYSWSNLTVSPGYNLLAGISGQLFDIQANFTPGSASAIAFNLCGVAITYAPATQQITCNGVTNPLPPVNGTVTLEVITDRQSVEIFGNSGQLYMPLASIGYSPTNNLVSLMSQGASTTFKYMTVNKLTSVWPIAGN
jgi:fructan beta-fructosidase